MPNETVVVDVGEQPELLAVARQVKRSGQQWILLHDGEELARLLPAHHSAPLRRGRRTSADDPFWSIVGMFDSGEPARTSEDRDAVLAAWEVDRNRP